MTTTMATYGRTRGYFKLPNPDISLELDYWNGLELE